MSKCVHHPGRDAVMLYGGKCYCAKCRKSIDDARKQSVTISIRVRVSLSSTVGTPGKRSTAPAAPIGWLTRRIAAVVAMSVCWATPCVFQI
jgi:hypothetical protein